MIKIVNIDKSSYSRKITVSDIKKMNIDEVYDWITQDIGIREEDKNRLEKLTVNGFTLLNLTKEDLINRFRLPLRPTNKIIDTLNKIKNIGI